MRQAKVQPQVTALRIRLIEYRAGTLLPDDLRAMTFVQAHGSVFRIVSNIIYLGKVLSESSCGE